MFVEGKSCIITGAANGVGRAIARRFAEDGAKVMLADRDEAGLQKVVEVLTDDGYEAQAFAGDLTKKLTVANLLSATLDAYDRVDILVNASRILEEGDPLDAKSALLSNLFDQNVVAAHRLTQAMTNRMIQQAEAEENDRSAGAVVNITSIAADRTFRNLAAYSVSCAALNQLTRSMAVALAEKRIRVNAVAVGSVMSNWMRESLKGDTTLREKVVAATPMGRIGDAEEAANAALYLASEGASFITGQVLTCDGGRTLLEPTDIPTY